MGDDLNFAQKFTRTAADGLTRISEMEDPRAANDSAVVIDLMTTLQRGAKRLRARNIYSSAQGVLSALHHDNDVTLTGRINNLGYLVTEYARGLDELLDTQETAAPQTHADKWDAARETLNALLPSAPPSDADMLSRLMRAPVTIDTVHPGDDAQDNTASMPDAEILPFATEEMTLDMAADMKLDLSLDAPAAEPKTLPKALLKKAPPKNDSPNVTLDGMMREVIADALSVARSVDRTISLSYDMGDRMVTETRADELRIRLGGALSQIIRQSLTPDRVGHIDINLAGEQFHIMAGTTAIRIAIEPKTAPQTAPAPQPTITSETESNLRDQLHKLMDPSSQQESAL